MFSRDLKEVGRVSQAPERWGVGWWLVCLTQGGPGASGGSGKRTEELAGGVQALEGALGERGHGWRLAEG